VKLIKAENITIAFGGHVVLRHVNMAVARGEIVTILGPNGSGKSTLVRALIGAERPVSGRVTRAARLRIGYVPQRLHIDPSLPITAGRFVRLAGGATSDRVAAALADVDASGTEDRALADLSGGQLQRVLLARALVSAPDLLVLDEATQGLDQKGVAGFYRLISDLRDRLNCGVLMVSHDLHVVMAASDRVICLNGHVCCEGAPEVVSEAPEYRALFGLGTGGTLALYRHLHDHDHDHGHDHDDGHDHGHDDGHGHGAKAAKGGDLRDAG